MRGVLCGPRPIDHPEEDESRGSEGRGERGKSPSPPLPPPGTPLLPPDMVDDSQSSSSRNKQTSEKSKQETSNKRDSESKNLDMNRNSRNTSDTGFAVVKKESKKSSQYTGISDIKGRGYQTFYGVRKRGGQSHLRTTYRKRSGYRMGHRRQLDSTFDVYGNSNSFDRQKVYDVFDENSNIHEHRRRSETGSNMKDYRRLDLGTENASDMKVDITERNGAETNTDRASDSSSEWSKDKTFNNQRMR
uniref:Btz domain-containing protein n=1 Tax=Trichobilharzia regenti TaxID=157069 RepID=A0AA85KJE4_TRIRE|nr:unnamed protein product [Trichobilharzia regenti]